MEKIVLRQILLDQQEFLASTEGLIPRDIEIEDLREGNEIVVISGIRRSGKSSLLRLISDELHKSSVFINFDDIRFSDFDISNYTDIEEISSELFGKEVVYLLDEVQNVPNWQRWVNNLHEKKIKVFVTGSNSNLLSSEISTYLTGRNKVVSLTPFSFREMLRLDGIEVRDTSLSTIEKGKVMGRFNRYMELGGFPEVLKRGDVGLSRNYFEDILTKDVIVRHQVRDVKELKDLSLFIMSNSGFPLSYSTLKNISGIKSVSTIKNHLDHLEEAYLVKRTDRFSYSIKRQKACPSKLYSGDIGFLRSVSFNFTENRGKILENLVQSHLARKGLEVYFHLERKECDFIVKRDLAVSEAFQVSYSMSDPMTREREFLGLIDAMRSYGLDHGTIITYDEEREVKRDGYSIRIVPAWKWLLEY